MSRGEGGGISIVFGHHGSPASGEKRRKVTQSMEIDTHLTHKPLRDAAIAKVAKPKKQPNLSKGERRAESEARKQHRENPKEVVVVQLVGGEIKSVRRIKRV